MSDPIIKGAKRPSLRPVTRSSSSASATKGRKVDAKTARPKPMAKRAGATKPPVRKAAKSKSTSGASASKTSQTTKSKRATTKSARTKVAATAQSRVARSKKPAGKTSANAKVARPSSRSAASRLAAKSQKRAPVTASKSRSTKASGTTAKSMSRPATTIPSSQPTQDEAAALRAFERAHKEFTRGRFAEARQLFRALIEQHAGVAEVTARARTYLAIAEARLRSEVALPRDAEALYDRGVIELNRGEYVAAQEMFERALKREPEAAHIHYGLAATRARLGSIDLALQSLERALTLQPNLRLRAQHDQDLAGLRNDPDYERLIFAARP